MNMRWGAALAVAGLIAAAGAGAQEAGPAPAKRTIRTRVPQAHLDAYVDSCAKNAPRASCWCVVEKLNATADGDFVIDMLGLSALGEPTKASVLAAVNRHGLRASQAKAIVDRHEAMLKSAADDCA